MNISETITRMRKKLGLTQAELGAMLGVSNQAVSKWESGSSLPDIMLLPALADAFGCSIDALFSREAPSSGEPQAKDGARICTTLPWEDDGVIRGVVFEGRRILKASDAAEEFTFVVEGEAKHVQSEGNIEIRGGVSGGCNAGGDVRIEGNVSGGCMANGDAVVAGNLSGGCNSGREISVGGNLSGGCNCGSGITVGCNLSGDIRCGGDVTVGGDVEAERIKGNVVCNHLKCERIEGEVLINQAK